MAETTTTVSEPASQESEILKEAIQAIQDSQDVGENSAVGHADIDDANLVDETEVLKEAMRAIQYNECVKGKSWANSCIFRADLGVANPDDKTETEEQERGIQVRNIVFGDILIKFVYDVSQLSDDKTEIGNCLQKWRLLLDGSQFHGTSYSNALQEEQIDEHQVKGMLLVASETFSDLLHRFGYHD